MNYIFNVLFEATDEEGRFFQNVYPLAESEEEAIDLVTEYLMTQGYIDMSIEGVMMLDSLEGIDDLAELEVVNGYIQNIKFDFDE